MRDHIPGMRCHYCGRQGGPKETLLTRHVSIQHLGRGRAKRIKRTLVATSTHVTNCCLRCHPPLVSRP